MKNDLTEQEQNLIKDLLKHIGRDDEFNETMAEAVGMNVEQFDNLADSIFTKLGNGRLIVQD